MATQKLSIEKEIEEWKNDQRIEESMPFKFPNLF